MASDSPVCRFSACMRLLLSSSTSFMSLGVCLLLHLTCWPALLPVHPLSIILLSLSIPLFFRLFLWLSAWSHLHSVFKHFRLFRADGHEVPVGV